MYFHVYLIYRFTRTFTDHSSVITRCWGFELQNGKSSLKSPQTLATQDFAPASFLSTPDKIPLKSMISEGFSYSLFIAAQNLSLSFLTYLFDSSCAKCETIIQVIRLSSIFSCIRTPSSRLSNFTFRTESADQICRQACLITI